MIADRISQFESFRKRLFSLLHFRKSATLDLIDALAGEPKFESVVKLSLSPLFRRKYSSLTDVMDSAFRSHLSKTPDEEDTKRHTLRITQLLADFCPYDPKSKFSLFVCDCSSKPRVFSEKVSDRTIVHAPTRVPGQKPITVGHQYSTLGFIPDDPLDRERHWIIPMSINRVQSHQSGQKVGIEQFEAVILNTVFKERPSLLVADSAYSTTEALEAISKHPSAALAVRMRGNRKVFREPSSKILRKGRPLLYGEEVLLSDPIEPDSQEFTVLTTRKGKSYIVCIDRWNNMLMQGAPKYPFDMIRATVRDQKGKLIFKKPLWISIMGMRRSGYSSIDIFEAYQKRYDIEHYFRFNKQKLGMGTFQTSDTRHEEIWLWMGLLSYNMLYHSRWMAQTIKYPWEKRNIKVAIQNKGPTEVQRDYGRIIQGFEKLASIPKPWGKSPGRKSGTKGPTRPACPVIRKSQNKYQETPLIKSKRGRPKGSKNRGGAK